MFSFFTKPKVVTLDEQLAHLKAAGIGMNAGIQIATLLESRSAGDYEKKPYILLLIVLGDFVEKPPYDTYISDDIWHFDSECIEDHGAYVLIAERLKALAGGGLPLENIKDYVDVEEERAELSFTLDGQAHAWQAKVSDDWVDSTIIERLVTLHEQRQSQKHYIYCGLGQDCLIGCVTDEQLNQLNFLLKPTGNRFVALTENTTKRHFG